MHHVGAAPTEALRNHLKWFLFLRVVVITCFLGAFAVVQLANGDFDDGSGLLHTIAATYAFSIVSAPMLARTECLAEFTYVQLGLDVLLITGAALVTGGARRKTSSTTNSLAHDPAHALLNGWARSH